MYSRARAHLRAEIFRHYRKCTSSVVASEISHLFAATYQFAISSYLHRALARRKRDPSRPARARVFSPGHAPISRRINHTSATHPFSRRRDRERERSIDRSATRAGKKVRVQKRRVRALSDLDTPPQWGSPSCPRPSWSFSAALSKARRRNSRIRSRNARETKTRERRWAQAETTTRGTHDACARARARLSREETAARARTPKIRK